MTGPPENDATQGETPTSASRATGQADALDLVPEVREALDDTAQRQYSAELTGEYGRARRLRHSIADGERAIGAGAGRYVYPLPDGAVDGGAAEEFVLKLAVPNTQSQQRDGKAQNRREARVWRRTESRHLVPVVAVNPEGYWLIMPRGERLHEEPPGLDEWATEVGDELDAIWESDIGEGNVVILDGERRLCDYGVGPPGG